MTSVSGLAAPPPLDAVSPVRLETVAALAGVGVGPLRRVLWLHCGEGIGPALLAAATAGTGAEVVAAAAAPAEAEAARRLAAEAGVPLEVHAAPADRPDALPGRFDLVALPSGWSRLDAAGREALARFLAERVGPGGAFLLGHEVSPGGRAAETLAQLLGLCWERAGEGPEAARAAEALAAAERLIEASHMLVRQMPDWAADLAALRALPPAALRRDWIAPRGPLWGMRRTGGLLARAGFARWTPAEPLRLAREADFSAAQLALIDAAPDPWSAAETADLAASRVRRLDLFVKPGGAAPALGARRVAGLAPPEAAPTRIRALGGPVALSRAAYGPLVAALEMGRGLEIGALAARLGEAPEALAERLAVLIGAGHAAPAAFAEETDSPDAARRASAALRRALAARGVADVAPAPLLGGARRLEPGRGTVKAGD